MTLKEDNESKGDYTERQLYDMITDIYSYVIEVVVSTPCTNDEQSFLFLDLDLSKSLNIEAKVKENIITLQRQIKANIVANIGSKVRVTFFSAYFMLPKHCCSSLSGASLVTSNPCSMRRQRKKSSHSWRVSLKRGLQSSVQRTMCCRYLLVPLSSFPSVSFVSSQLKR